jgi:uncharacterized protein YehS (DUF1456 family)
MKNIKEVFEKIQEQKKEQREINKSVRDALYGSVEYRELTEKLQNIRIKKIQLERSVRGDVEQKIDLLKLNIKDGMQVMSDIALTALMKGDSIKLTDSDDNEYEPIFSIRFKKTNNYGFKDEKPKDK